MKEKFKKHKNLIIIISSIFVLLLGFLVYINAFNLDNHKLGKSTLSTVGSTIEEDVGLGDNSEVEYYSSNSEGDIKETSDIINEEEFISQESENQKLVYSGDISINTEDLDKTYKEVMSIMKTNEGKIESIKQFEDEIIFSIRVKKDKFINLYDGVRSVSGDITRSILFADDLTKEYVDNSRKLETIQAEYDDLKKLMDKAETVEEVLTIKDKLYDLSYQMDSLEQNNNNIDYDSEFSTLTVTIMKAYSGSNYKIPFSKQLKEAFSNSIELIETFIVFLVHIWWILVPIIIFLGRKKLKNLFIKRKD